jgi:hypothetical protein
LISFGLTFSGDIRFFLFPKQKTKQNVKQISFEQYKKERREKYEDISPKETKKKVPSNAIDKTKEHQQKQTIVSTLHNKTQKSPLLIC